MFLSSPDRQTKVDYYVLNVYPHYTATSQAFSDLIKFQQWDELAIITEHAESKSMMNRKKKSIRSFVFCFSCLDLLYLQDLLKLPSDMSQMKVTVRQLQGRPGINNWHPLLQQMQEIGVAKFLIDVSTDHLDDFFQHVRHLQTKRDEYSSHSKLLFHLLFRLRLSD